MKFMHVYNCNGWKDEVKQKQTHADQLYIQ